MTKATPRTWVVLLAFGVAVIVVVLQHVSDAVQGGNLPEPSNHQVQGRHRHRHLTIEESSVLDTNVSSSSSSSLEVEILAAMTEKLTTPRELAMDNTFPNQLAMHQFIHLHHMKTGGTSMDRYLDCARDRLHKDMEYTIPYGNVHECSRDYYQRCKSGQDARCQKSIADAAMLSYCAPLKDLPSFSWGALEHGINVTVPPSHGAITVLRDPVDRVWSMYRFKTRACYQCKPLLEIYQSMDAGDMMNMDASCSQQLQNHQVANLLSTEWLQGNNQSNVTTNDDNDDERDNAMLAEAIKNMKSFFTVIGLTEHLDETIEIAGRVFPWMKPRVAWSSKQCALSHANAAPQNNGCGPSRTHWELPDHPDEETRAAIEAHNPLDRKLYAAAVQHFELQKRAVALDEEQT